MTEETKYNSDKAEPQLDTVGLDQLFNVDRSSVILETPDNTNKQLQEIGEMRKEIQALADSSPDADKILHDNIIRANRLLDAAEDTFEKGGLDNRRLEVMAGLINAITAASSSIMGESYNQQVLEQKSREIDIKEQQLLVKQTLGKGDGSGSNITQNNIIVSSREDLLKLINSEESKEAEDIQDI